MRLESKFPIFALEKIVEKIDYGLTASATEIGHGPKFLRITDIQDGQVNWSEVPLCEADQKAISKYSLDQGDIVFARTGATTGKSYLIRECPEESVFASYLIRVRPSTDIVPEYLARFFQTPIYWRQINRNTSGTAQGGVNASKLKTLSIPVPPIKEQRRIAAIADKADAIRRKRKEAIRLTESLLRSAFLDMFGDPVTNPKGWPTARLDTFSTIQSGIAKGKKVDLNNAISVPYMRVANVQDGYLDLEEIKELPVTAKDAEKYQWRCCMKADGQTW